MTSDKITQNTGPKYSEMLIQLVQEFDDLLPAKLTFEETIEAGIDAWNLANNKQFLVSRDLYEQELKNHENCNIIEKMVDFKLEKFATYNNVIVEYNFENNLLKVITQSQETRFDNLVRTMMKIKPK